MSVEIALQLVKRSDPDYQSIRDGHYVENNGAGGRQAHFIIWYKGEEAGIISAGMSVWGTAPRDKFFGIAGKTKEEKKRVHDNVVNNTVYHLTNHEYGLGSRVINVWCDVVPAVWDALYNTEVIGYETFVIPTGTRSGTLYRHAGWKKCGWTYGSARVTKHMGTKDTRKEVERKLVYCRHYWRDPSLRWVDFLGSKLADKDGIVHGVDVFVADAWLHPSWHEKSVRDKSVMKLRKARQKALFGMCFFIQDGYVRFAELSEIRDAWVESNKVSA